MGITNRDELKSRIMAIFEKSDHQEQVLIGLYRMVFPDWDRIVKIKDTLKPEMISGNSSVDCSRNLTTITIPTVCPAAHG